jgi:hypothetical protein
MEKKFISNSSESQRMFKRDWMEALSKVHFSVPLFIYVPVILYFGWNGFVVAAITDFLLAIVGGLFVWTFTEYIGASGCILFFMVYIMITLMMPNDWSCLRLSVFHWQPAFTFCLMPCYQLNICILFFQPSFRDIYFTTFRIMLCIMLILRVHFGRG